MNKAISHKIIFVWPRSWFFALTHTWACITHVALCFFCFQQLNNIIIIVVLLWEFNYTMHHSTTTTIIFYHPLYDITSKETWMLCCHLVVRQQKTTSAATAYEILPSNLHDYICIKFLLSKSLLHANDCGHLNQTPSKLKVSVSSTSYTYLFSAGNCVITPFQLDGIRGLIKYLFLAH